jgi:hypothetical protein
MTNEAIIPFRVDVPQSDLDDLRRRLAATRWAGQLPGAPWERGVPVDNLRELAAYWANGYDWRKHEAELNEYPQFTTEIDGQRIHFLHVRSANPDALPLLLSHGWPGSVVEFLDVIGPLSEDFHLVIPSIPGFAFSGPTSEAGWDSHRIATAYAQLMARLGYERTARRAATSARSSPPTSAGWTRRTSSACTSTRRRWASSRSIRRTRTA